jgi:hypothetical protein
MSSYTSSSATISPSVRFLQQIVASGSTFFDLSCPVASSLQLTQQRSLLQSAGLNAGWASLSTVPGALDALRQGAPAQLAAFTALRGQAAQTSLTGGAGETLRREAADHLMAALDTTVDLLRSDERQVTAAAMQTALTKLGYTVPSPKVGGYVTGIAAYKDDHVIAAVVAEGGAVEIDTRGLSGGSCAEPLNALHDALRALGIEMRIERRIDHGDSNGGTLIRRAAAVNATDLAAGLVAAAEPTGGRRTTTRTRRGQRGRSQAIGGSA